MAKTIKITKFVHSCVLVEYDGSAVLFDPGVFSWNSGLIDINSLPEIQNIVISHQHSDHCHEAYVKALLARYPSVDWFAPTDAHDLLRSWGVENVSNQSAGPLMITEQNHAQVEPFGVQVNNLITHFAGLVTHPGDTHNFLESQDILLLPIQAPWGTTVRALELVLELRPKYVMPIHDWMWNDDWRNSTYKRFEQILSEQEIRFLTPIDGQTIEVAINE